MHPATEIALHLANVYAAQRRALATRKSRDSDPPHSAPTCSPTNTFQAKALAAAQIAGREGAQSAPAEPADDGRWPTRT